MILFRIDLSIKDGLGHYNRIKSLVKYLDLKRYQIIIDKLPNTSFFKNEKENFISLYEKNSHFTDEKKDASLFLKIIKNKYKNPLVIKDSYRLGYSWEKLIYNFCKKTISIEDFTEKKHFVDCYINHSPAFLVKNDEINKKLKKNNKKNCKFLLGPDYALFNSLINRKEKIISDLVFYNGGSGNLLVYEKIIKKIIKIKKGNFKIIIIVGPFAKNYKAVCFKFKKYKNIKILYQPKNILSTLIGTKVFISSAGVSTFESSFLKIPTLLFKMNDNQNLSDFDYEKLGHYFSLEKKDLNYSDKIVNLIILMLKNRIQIKKMMSKSTLNIKSIKKNYQKFMKF
jgi:spore coat polysaccharide biosynthesis predicted glycosyltransferase SpsG|tara:strand:- start:5526 stop:6545 length:1020 start_codon:yes stop_codon:yes gene_type:complete